MRGRAASLPRQQRTALASIAVALALVALKLIVGIISHSLGLIAEAIHSGTDLVAAVLTFFAVGVAVRPADVEHPFGHGKAEHLSALAEGAVLVIASVVIAVEAIGRLTEKSHPVQAVSFALGAAAIAIVLDLFRWLSSARSARRHASPALHGNAVHFALDMVGSVAVLIGLVLVHSGDQHADSVAALLVAALVLVSAGRLMRRNVQALMDTAPLGAAGRARTAIEHVEGALSVRRVRVRESGGRYFADVVVGVRRGTDVAGGHAVASAVEDAVERELPGCDVVVHIEPHEEPLRRRSDADEVVLRLTISLRGLADATAAERLAAEIEDDVRHRHAEARDVHIEIEGG